MVSQASGNVTNRLTCSYIVGQWSTRSFGAALLRVRQQVRTTRRKSCSRRTPEPAGATVDGYAPLAECAQPISCEAALSTLRLAARRLGTSSSTARYRSWATRCLPRSSAANAMSPHTRF